MTNYDKIRNMTLDEMAEFIFRTYFPCDYSKSCRKCTQIIQDFCELTSDAKSDENIKQWLESESKQK